MADKRFTPIRADTVRIGAVTVRGQLLDAQTRCVHYHGTRDIIAIRFFCCKRWYLCWKCHDAGETHDAEPWPRGHGEVLAVLCGRCGHRLSVGEYLHAGDVCPRCGAAFNPGCAHHRERYFQQ